MYKIENDSWMAEESHSFSENFVGILNSHLRDSTFRYAFDFDGVLTVISPERKKLQKIDGEAYSSPEQFSKDSISPVGVMAINLSWSEPIAIITNREASLTKIAASIDWLSKHGARISNIMMVMRQEGVSHTKAEHKYEVLSQLVIEQFYLDDKESTVLEIQNKCPNVHAHFYSSEVNPEVLVEYTIDAMASTTIKVSPV